MKSDLQFQFLADVPGHTLRIKREFAGPRDLIWDCYTKQELLEKWFAPKPLKTKTASMEFREGGHWHYAMYDDDGTEYWGWTDYVTIDPQERYTTRDAFSDATGAPNTDLPVADWVITFEDAGDRTIVRTVIDYSSPESLQTVIDMGMEEGLGATYVTLDNLIETLKG